MLNGRTVAVMLFIGCLVTGAGFAQDRTLADNWNDFLHYTKIGRLDLAKGYAQAILQGDPNAVELLELSRANPEGYQVAMRVIDTAKDEELVSLTKQLLAVIEKGRFERRSDPDVIVEEIRRLSTTIRGKMNATKRLKDAGEYAVPFMLDAMADPTRRNEFDNIVEALPQIGRMAIRPLCASLQMENASVKAEVIRALGRIGYPQSVAYLKYVVENDPATEMRDLATESLKRIDPETLKAPAEALFYQLAEKYYYHDESLAPQEGAPIANIWFWDESAGRLVRTEVDPAYFNELMCMRCCEWSLKSNNEFGLAIGLWLAGFFKAEATGLPMPDYFGKNHASALVYATTAGPEYLHQALARAVNDKNAAVALGAVEALATNAGEQSLMYSVGPAQPLLAALSFRDDRAVRYSAAIAIANAGPRKAFNEAGLVVKNLSEALSSNGREASANDPNWTAEMAQSYALRAVKALLKVAVSRNPVIDLSQAQPALIQAATGQRKDLQVLAGQTLAYLNRPGAQRTIAGVALDGNREMDIRIEAFKSLAASAKLHGDLLTDPLVDQIYELVSSDQTDPDLRAAAAAAYGSLNLPSQKVKDLILDQAKS